LQVLAALSEPVQDFGVADGKGHLEVRSWFGGGLVEDGVDEPSSRAEGQVTGLYVKVDVNRALVGIGVIGGLGQEAATVGQSDVFGCAGHVILPVQLSLRRADETAVSSRIIHAGTSRLVAEELVVADQRRPPSTTG
jgi:hypothetical protein